MGRKGWLLAWLAAVPVPLARAGDMHESDTFWQVRTGELIIDTRRLPVADAFSWTAAGRRWELNSWGFDLVLGCAYRAGGLPAVALVAVAFAMLAAAAVLLLAHRLGATPAAAGLTLAATQVTLVDWLGARPQLVDYAAVPLLLVLLLAWHAERRRAALAGIAALHVAWVNLHSVAPLGIGLCAAAALTSPGTWPRRAAPVAVATVAVLANPRGLALFVQGAAVRRESSDLIREWLPPDPTEWTHVAPLLIAVAGLVVAARRRQWPVAAAIGMLTAAGLVMLRFGPMAALTGAAAVAVGLSGPRVRAWAVRRRAVLVFGAITGVLALSALAAPALTRLGRTEVPPRVVRALPPGCRLLNEYILGGHVILWRPDVPVSLDSRNDLYGAAEVRRLQDAFDKPRPELLDDLAVTCVLTREDRPLAARLHADPAWRVAASTGGVAAFTRREPG
jgi:hypothetical protein